MGGVGKTLEIQKKPLSGVCTDFENFLVSLETLNKQLSVCSLHFVDYREVILSGSTEGSFRLCELPWRLTCDFLFP